MISYYMLPNSPERGVVVPLRWVLYALAALLSLSAYILYRESTIADELAAGRFYLRTLKDHKLPKYWRMSRADQRREEKMGDRMIVEHGSNRISREELGRQSWTLLHTISATFPERISAELAEQFNAYMTLFAKFYPCKLCANHFSALLQREGPFKGSRRSQLMEYVCRLHNRVNLRLGKPEYDCDLVLADWSTCGCSAPPFSL